ncbi:MAG: long-chain-fatty-acid--CoA ligase [Myxococcales bacterium]|nr:long-chain-fatty-acid--CoA ligase [Myxococcales bacterium]
MLLHDFLDYLGRANADRPCIECGDRRIDYGEALGHADRLARALASQGLAAGDRFAVLAKNCLEYPLFYFAGSKSGAVPVPLNYRLAPPELAYIVRDANARLVIARGELVEALDGVRDELGDVKTWVSLDGPRPEGWIDYAEWLRGQPEGPPDHRGDDHDDLYQMYTSGTTGRPKGAVLTHAAVAANLIQQLAPLSSHPDDHSLVVAPIYHAAAALAAIGSMVSGGSMVVHEDFSPADVVHALSEGGVTRTMLVPAMIQACLVLVPDAADRDYENLRMIVYGASPIAADVLRNALDVFRCDFAQGYGMTETTATLTVLSPADHRRALAGRPELLLSAGRPLPGTEIRIVDGDDRPVAAGSVGEIVGRGDQLMRGYWNQPEASAEALRGGWMHTGDAGILDEDGYLFIQDRVKDMVVSGGENVYPREVENALFEHPAVVDVAVIGIPDEKWGESVKAIVVVRQGAAASADDLVEFCRGRLAGFKCPRSVDFVAELPRNASGKLLKKELREKYWRGRDRRVS